MPGGRARRASRAPGNGRGVPPVGDPHRQHLIAEAAGTILAALDLETMWPAVHDCVAQVLAADRTALFQYDPDTDRLSCDFSMGLSTQYVTGMNRRFRDAPGSRLLAEPGPIVVEDALADPNTEAIRDLIALEGYRAFAAFGLGPPGAVKGALVAYRDRPGPFSDDDLAAGHTLSRIVAVGLRNIELFRAERRRSQELAVLQAVAAAAAEAHTVDGLIERATDVVGRTLFPDNFGLLMVNKDAAVLRPHVSFRGLSTAPGTPTLPLGTGICGRVAATGHPCRVGDVADDPEYVEVMAGVRSGLAVPVVVNDTVCAVLAAESRRPDAFTAADEHLLTTFADELSTGISRAMLFEAVRDSEERYRAVAEFAVDAIVSTDAAGRIETWNPAAENVFGYGSSEIIGRRVTALLSPSSRARFERLMAKLEEGRGRPVAVRWVELEGRRHDGSVFPLEASISGWRHAGAVRYTGIIRDITERKMSQDALRRRAADQEAVSRVAAELRSAESPAEVLRTALRHGVALGEATLGLALVLAEDNGDLVISAVDPPGLVSPGAQVPGRAGLAGRAVLSGNVEVAPSLGGDPLASALGEAVTEAILAGPCVAVPMKAEQAVNGVLVLCRGDASPPNLSATQVLAAVADVTGDAWKRATLVASLEDRVHERTNELSRAYARLKDLDRLKSKFVSDVSHELRTPVSSLRLYLHLLRKGDAGKRDRYLEVAEKQAARLTHLVEDILELGRLDSGADRPRMGAVDLNRVVQQVIATHSPRAQAIGLRLAADVEPDLPSIRGDRDRLTTVGDNLVSNALNYTPEGHVRVSTCRQDGGLRLQVEDTGVGISHDDVPNLFERFYRGGNVGQLDIPGTGLGLAIVKEIVELHGGRVDAAPRPNGGSSFTVWLPLS
ncbi:MAG: ATP-binding protein [Anaerolineae bacterium]